MFFCILAHGDIADRSRDQDAFGALQGAEHDLDRELSSILAAPGELDAHSALLRGCSGRAPRAVGDQAFCEAFGNDVADLLTCELVAAISELLLRLNVDE